MLKSHFICLFTLLVNINGYAQNLNYNKIDSLLEQEKLIDGITALDLLKTDYKNDSLNSIYWAKLSRANYVVYNYDKAKANIDKAISLSPKGSEYYFQKGFLLNRIGESENSIHQFNLAIDLDKNPKYYCWRGIVKQNIGKIDEAEQDYLYAYENKFETFEMLYNYANLLMQKGKLTLGISIVNKVINLKPKFPGAYALRSRYNLLLLNFDESCEDDKKAINLKSREALNIQDSICNASDWIKYAFASEFLIENKMYSQAIDVFNQMDKFNIDNYEIILNRGLCHYELGEFLKAEKYYLEALKLSKSENVTILENLVLLYIKVNKHDLSISYCNKLIRLNPNKPEYFLDRGLSYRKLKKYRNAYSDFKQALNLNSQFFRAYGYRSYLNLKLGKFDEAYKDAEKSIEINPNYGYGHLVLGEIKRAMGIQDYCLEFMLAKKLGHSEGIDALKKYCNE